MFLENMMQTITDPEHSRMLQLIISQLNLLLCLVNDVLDIKLIESGKFEPKIQEFSPLETLQFIHDMFSPQASMQKSNLSFKTVSVEVLRSQVKCS